MLLSATSSDPTRGIRRAVVALVVAGCALSPGPARASDLATVDEVLAVTFPDAEMHRESVFLTADQVSAVERSTSDRPHTALVTRFRADREGATVGWAYLDTHRVRTLPETLLVLIDPDGAIIAIEVVAFREPTDYLPPGSWYRQFDGRRLDEDLQLKRGIRPITGATLTARATTTATRRVLAIHTILEPDGGDR